MRRSKMYCILLSNGYWKVLKASSFSDAEIEASEIVKTLNPEPGQIYFVVPTGTFEVYKMA
jgi:hypothetical protein